MHLIATCPNCGAAILVQTVTCARCGRPVPAGEYVIVVPSGTPEGEWAGWEWHYVSDAGTLNFTAPDVPGDYEIRFATEATNPNTTITWIPLTVN